MIPSYTKSLNKISFLVTGYMAGNGSYGKIFSSHIVQINMYYCTSSSHWVVDPTMNLISETHHFICIPVYK